MIKLLLNGTKLSSLEENLLKMVGCELHQEHDVEMNLYT